MIDIKDFKKLIPYEADLKRAWLADYKLPTPGSEDMVIEEILHKYEPKEAERIVWSCGNCSLRAYSRVGRLFYEYKEQKEAKTDKNKSE